MKNVCIHVPCGTLSVGVQVAPRLPVMVAPVWQFALPRIDAITVALTQAIQVFTGRMKGFRRIGTSEATLRGFFVDWEAVWLRILPMT